MPPVGRTQWFAPRTNAHVRIFNLAGVTLRWGIREGIFTLSRQVTALPILDMGSFPGVHRMAVAQTLDRRRGSRWQILLTVTSTTRLLAMDNPDYDTEEGNASATEIGVSAYAPLPHADGETHGCITFFEGRDIRSELDEDAPREWTASSSHIHWVLGVHGDPSAEALRIEVEYAPARMRTRQPARMSTPGPRPRRGRGRGRGRRGAPAARAGNPIE